MTARLVSVTALVLACVSPLAARAQTPAPEVVGQALRLRSTGDFARAADLLRSLLVQQPDHAAAARLLGETLYWLQDVSGARAVYDAALVHHPEDAPLRLLYARMLAETGGRAGARALLAPLERQSPRADVEALLGTLAYWEGDFTTARRRFEAALRVDPAQADARRQLQEILSVTRPWVRLSSDAARDDQPLDRVGLGVEAGWFATPLMPVKIRVQPGRYGLDDVTSRAGWSGEVEVTHYAPAVRLETEVAAGVFRHPSTPPASAAADLDWQGRAGLGVRLPAHVTARVRLERMPYLSTRASLETPVTSRTATGLVRWQDPRGWLGEAAYGRRHFPDGNTIDTLYAWQLVPLVWEGPAQLQAGYAFGRDHSAESRFSTAGRYDPYYTPSRVVTHAAIGSAMVRPSAIATIRVGGSYAFDATEDAPVLYVSAGQILRTTYVREFSPWNARASIELALGPNVLLSANGEAGSEAFYRWSAAGVQLTYRLP